MADELRSFDPDDLTIRGAIALATLAAEHVAPLLEHHAAASAAISDALRADWTWIETASPGARELYDEHMPTLWEAESELDEDSPALAAFHCGLEAHMYAIWSVDGAERLHDPGTDIWLPEDLHNVDEEDIVRCAEQAIELSPHAERTAAWLNEVIDGLERDQHATEDDNLVVPQVDARASFETRPSRTRRSSFPGTGEDAYTVLGPNLELRGCTIVMRISGRTLTLAMPTAHRLHDRGEASVAPRAVV